MELIDISKIRGSYSDTFIGEDGRIIGVNAGDDSEKSMIMIADKLNELITKLKNEVHPNL